uniref:Hypotheticial protein n=1 Tax=Schistosoma japonicum TaxID=6182 RepID=C1LID4_SCHJA|nr:hypotheticial protein [Schistosoma japonicum]
MNISECITSKFKRTNRIPTTYWSTSPSSQRLGPATAKCDV